MDLVSTLLRWTLSGRVQAALLLLAPLVLSACGEWKGGFSGVIDAPVEDVWPTAQDSLGTYGIKLDAVRSHGSRTEFRVAEADFLVEIAPARDGSGTGVLIACDCPWPAIRELLDAVLDDQEVLGRRVTRPAYPHEEPTHAEVAVLTELRRRSGR